jgi:hypothetical protein
VNPAKETRKQEHPESHRLIYASETWTMWKEDESRLESVETKNLQSVKGFIRTKSRNTTSAADKISERENEHL